MQKIQELIVEEFIAQKSRFFLWIPVFFAIGVGVYFTMKQEPFWGLGAILSIVFLIMLLWLWRQQEKSPYFKFSYITAFLLFFVAFGFTMAQWRAHQVYAPMLLKKMSPVEVEGDIETIEPLGEADGARVILNDIYIERLSANKTPRKIRLKILKNEGLKVGQRIRILAGLNPASGPVAPHAFDFQRMMYFQEIGAVGFAYTTPEILEETTQSPLSLKNIREHISAKIQAQTEAPQESIIVALMTGQRGAITDGDWKALRDSGLAHLLAISGLHVGMVAGVLFFFSRFFMACSARLALHHPIKKYAAAIALIGTFFYTIMVGATVPTQRALIMTGFVMIAIMLDRSPFSLRLVALAALMVLLVSPESLTSVSFQMSFSAVVALICFYEWLRPVWVSLHRQSGMTRRFALYFAGVSLTTIIAGFATGLFALYHFQNFALYGVLANMVAVPLMAFIVMPLIVLSYVVMPLGLEGFVFPFIEWGVGWILATAHYVAGLEGAVWHVPAWPHWIFVTLVFCFWTLMVWKGRLKVVLIPVVFILTVLIPVYKQPDIMISSKVDLVGVRSNDGSIWLSTGQKERFTADNWMRLNGEPDGKKRIWPKEGSLEAFPLSCDPFGCRGEIEGQKISVAYSNKAWREDCEWADIIISQNPVPNRECYAKHVIDFFDVWRDGPHVVWLSPNKIKIQSVEEVRGKRLWAQTSANAKK